MCIDCDVWVDIYSMKSEIGLYSALLRTPLHSVVELYFQHSRERIPVTTSLCIFPCDDAPIAVMPQ